MSILSRLSELFGYKVTIEKIGENKNKEKPANKTASNNKNNTKNQLSEFDSDRMFFKLKELIYGFNGTKAYDYEAFKSTLEKFMSEGFDPAYAIDHRKYYGGEYRNLLSEVCSTQIGQIGIGDYNREISESGNRWLKIIQYLLTKNIDLNFIDEKGNAPLHYLLKPGVYNNKACFEAVKLMLQKPGVDLNLTTSNGQTPMMLAARFPSHKERQKLLEMLIDAGADVTATDKDGNNLLYYTNDSVIVRKLLCAGLDINCRNNNGTTPLMYKAGNGNISALQYWLDIGTDINAKDNNNNGILHYAFDSWNSLPLFLINEMQMLLSKGADINAQNNLKQTPLLKFCCHIPHLSLKDISASQNEISNILDEFAKNGADFTARDYRNRMGIHYLASAGDLKGIQYCITKGCDINAEDNDGYTPFGLLCRYVDMLEEKYDPTELANYFEEFIENGADVGASKFLIFATDKDFFTKISYNTLKKIVSNTTDLECRNAQNQTALECLCWRYLDQTSEVQRQKLMQIIRLLIKEGAEYDLTKFKVSGVIKDRYKELVSMIEMYRTQKEELLGHTSDAGNSNEYSGWDYEL